MSEPQAAECAAVIQKATEAAGTRCKATQPWNYAANIARRTLATTAQHSWLTNQAG